jgi:trans-2,3-dihydro-3-hydroxyanthranilate isomerase
MPQTSVPRSYAVETVDVFTDQRFSGNQLAVFTDGRGLSDAEMQQLAAEMNLSETTFVLPPADAAHTAHLRIFHRTGEMTFAGHPTLGSGFVLGQRMADRRNHLYFEVKAGIVPVTLDRDTDGIVIGGTIGAPQPLTTSDTFTPELVAQCVGLRASDINTASHLPILASVGTVYLIAEVRPDALRRASPVIAAFQAALAERPHLAGRLSVHLYARDGHQLRARMFAPVAGTWEDPATGSANTALAALLLSLGNESDATYHIAQGVEMGRPSQLTARAVRGADGIRATVSGRCVPVLTGTVQL